MQKYPDWEIWKDFISVLSGTALSLTIIISSWTIAGLLVFSDTEVPGSAVIISNVFIISGSLVGSFSGSYLASGISVRKKSYHFMLIDVILIFLSFITINFDLNNIPTDELISLILIIPSSYFGSLFGNKKKRNKIISNRNSSPPGIL